MKNQNEYILQEQFKYEVKTFFDLFAKVQRGRLE